MRTLLLATRNEGKVRELGALLAGEPVHLETLASHPDVPDVEEHGDTFEENARLKAVAVAEHTGRWALGEDSGLVVDALGGDPGVRSARYAGEHGDDAANVARLLRELEGVRDRRARFLCALVLARPDGKVVAAVEGVCEGTIAAAPRGTAGFGYDPVFVPLGETRTAAELTPAEKDALSHRGHAARSLLPLLRLHLTTPAWPPD